MLSSVRWNTSDASDNANLYGRVMSSQSRSANVQTRNQGSRACRCNQKLRYNGFIPDSSRSQQSRQPASRLLISCDFVGDSRFSSGSSLHASAPTASRATIARPRRKSVSRRAFPILRRDPVHPRCVTLVDTLNRLIRFRNPATSPDSPHLAFQGSTGSSNRCGIPTCLFDGPRMIGFNSSSHVGQTLTLWPSTARRFLRCLTTVVLRASNLIQTACFCFDVGQSL